MQQILDTNPQIENPSWIYPDQQICIPFIANSQTPKITSIDFIDEERQPLPEVGKFIKLAPKTIIKVSFSTEVSCVFFFRYPVGTNVCKTIHFLGLVGELDKKEVEFLWKEPENIMDFLFIVGCAGNTCVKSEKIGVLFEEKTKKVKASQSSN